MMLVFGARLSLTASRAVGAAARPCIVPVLVSRTLFINVGIRRGFNSQLRCNLQSLKSKRHPFYSLFSTTAEGENPSTRPSVNDFRIRMRGSYSQFKCTKDDLAEILLVLPGVKNTGIISSACKLLKHIDRADIETARRCVGVIGDAFHDSYASEPFKMLPHTICECLSGLKNFNNDLPEVSRLLSFLLTQLQSAEGESKVRSWHVSKALHGFQYATNDTETVRGIFVQLTSLIDKYVESFNGQQTSDLLKGLRNMKGDIPELSDLLSAVAPKIIAGEAAWNAGHAGTCLRSLRHLTSGSNGVRDILCAIAPKIDSCTGSISGQHLSRALNGLQGMRGNLKQTRLLLSAITPMISRCNDQLSGIDIGLALLGFKSMSSEFIEVRRALGELASMVSLSTDPMDAQSMANALYGLQRCRSESKEVRALLSALTPKVMSIERFSVSDVIPSFYGISRMSSSTPEVLSLLKALTPLVQSCALSSQSIERLKKSLSNMDPEVPEVRDLLQVIEL